MIPIWAWITVSTLIVVCWTLLLIERLREERKQKSPSQLRQSNENALRFQRELIKSYLSQPSKNRKVTSSNEPYQPLPFSDFVWGRFGSLRRSEP